MGGVDIVGCLGGVSGVCTVGCVGVLGMSVVRVYMV